MASWYCGSVQHAAIAQWAASTAYSVGDIRRQLAAPTAGNERAFRCTTAGTSGGSEPAWTLTKAATTNDNTAVWTEVTGNSTYGWSAAHARLKNAVVSTWMAAGDTCYVASNHSYLTAASYSIQVVGTVSAPSFVICVNAAGSVPPVSADLATGAVEGTTGANGVLFGAAADGYAYLRGVTIQSGDSSNTASISVSDAAFNMTYVFDSCALVLNNTSTSSRVNLGANNAAAVLSRVVLKNTPVTFGATGQFISLRNGRIDWVDTSSAIAGSVPTTLLSNTSQGSVIANIEGVDLSAAGSGKTLVGSLSANTQINFQNSRLGSSVTISGTPAARGSAVTVVNTDSGATGNRQEKYTYEGTLTTEGTIVLTGGASDGVASLSWKVVTTANTKYIMPFETFPIAVWNAVTGSSVTATVEIITDNITLTDEECWVEAHYLSSASYPVSSLVSDAKADILATAANQTSSSVTWTTTGLTTPLKQKLSVSFTPQMIGYVRLVVKVAKASTTVYIDPKVTLS